MITEVIKALKENPRYRSREADIAWGRHYLYTTWKKVINHIFRR
jgi:hypothetical protein